MRIVVRIFFIGIVWLLVAGIIERESHHDDSRRFSLGKRPLIAAGEKPFFKNEIINPGQLLPMVHVASLAELSDGALAAVWYGGTAECSPDVQIFFSTRQESEGWSKPHTIMTRVQAEDDLGRPMKSLGNAVLLANANGSLRLLFVTIAMGKWSGSQLNSSRSEDGGLTWLRTERLTLSPLCNFSELVRNRPIPLQGGGWCVPIYQEFLGKFPELLWLREARGDLIVQKTRIAGGCSTLQPSVVPLSPHSGLVLLRDYTQAKKIFLSRTEDGGLSWSKPEPTLLPNPDAGISGLRISGGRLLVAFNDSMLNRENLSLALSADEGRSWGRIATLENEQGGSFSYPYLLHTSDGSIAMAYTWKSKQIKLVRFNEAWITAQEKRSAGL